MDEEGEKIITISSHMDGIVSSSTSQNGVQTQTSDGV